MPILGKFLIARTAGGRPTLMHRVSLDDPGYTACGWPLAGWSCAFQAVLIRQLLCRRCGH